MCEIAVVGSINMDLVSRVEELPKPGETVLASQFEKFPGGKGANQAVGAAKLDRKVEMFGMVGQDAFGEELLCSLGEYGVDAGNVRRQEGSSGVATILVNSRGENIIAVAPGANAEVDTKYVKEVLDHLEESKILLLQLEIPHSSVMFLLSNLPLRRPQVILDPAPAQNAIEMLNPRIDILTPNIRELESLTKADLVGERSIEEASLDLIRKTGVRTIICKAGENGCFLIEEGRFQHFPAMKVKVVDTTAAGDAFNAALSVALGTNKALEECIRYANVAAALSTTKAGAQPSMPDSEEITRILQE